MIPYWIIFSIPIIGVISPLRINDNLKRATWFSFVIFLIIFIGLRENIGGDWARFIDLYNRSSEAFEKFKPATDYGYETINFLVRYATWYLVFPGLTEFIHPYRHGVGIHFLNLIVAFFTILALSSFCLKQRNPWLAMVVAVPYIIFVVSMGYQRQGIAFSFILIAIQQLIKNKQYHFLVYILLATLFHKTALIMIILLFASKIRLLQWLLLFTIPFFFIYFLYEGYSVLIYNYITQTEAPSSQGTVIRLMVNTFPAILFLMFRKKITTNIIEQKIYFLISLLTILFLFIFIFNPGASSTTIDRLLIYLTPLQLFFYPRISSLLSTDYYRIALHGVVIVLYSFILFVWLNFSVHAEYWIPYDTILLDFDLKYLINKNNFFLQHPHIFGD